MRGHRHDGLAYELGSPGCVREALRFAPIERRSSLVAAQDLDAADRALGPRLLLVHAEGDDRVPVEGSRRLHVAAPGSRLIAVPGGDHHSAQHDPELQAEALRFLLELTVTP